MTGAVGVGSQVGLSHTNGSGCPDDFGVAIQNAQAGMAGSMPANAHQLSAYNSGAGFGTGLVSRPLPSVASSTGQGFGPPPSAGRCARTGGASCGCNGNVSSNLPTTLGGAPMSSFDFMSGNGAGRIGSAMTGSAMTGSSMTGTPMTGSSMGAPVQAGSGMSTGLTGGTMPGASFPRPFNNGGLGYGDPIPSLFNGYPAVPSLLGEGMSVPTIAQSYAAANIDPRVMHAGGMHGGATSGAGMVGSGMIGSGMAGGGAMHGGMHAGMPAHDGHGYYSLDGIGMVHAKDEVRAGMHLGDNGFFDRLASGEYGAFSGVSLDQDEAGNLEGQVYISGHPAAFHQLYDEGVAKGLTGEELNQYIAEELTNVNDIDDIDQEYYDLWEERGYPPPTRDHDLHNTGSIAVVLAPGQELRLTGAHQYDTRRNEEYNFTDVQSDANGTFVELYRLSNNNNSGNGHHEDLVLAAKIYLDETEIEDIANGADPLEIANRRVRVDDDTDDYRISTGAINLLAQWGMPIY